MKIKIHELDREYKLPRQFNVMLLVLKDGSLCIEDKELRNWLKEDKINFEFFGKSLKIIGQEKIDNFFESYRFASNDLYFLSDRDNFDQNKINKIVENSPGNDDSLINPFIDLKFNDHGDFNYREEIELNSKHLPKGTLVLLADAFGSCVFEAEI